MFKESWVRMIAAVAVGNASDIHSDGEEDAEGSVQLGAAEQP
jgi:hypothetical protein